MTPAVLVALALFSVIHLLSWIGFQSVFVASYADDLLCMPLVLGVTQAVHRWTERDSGFRLPGWHVALVLALFALLFEGVLPYFSLRYTADPADVLCYVLGALVFLVFMRGEGLRHLTWRPSQEANMVEKNARRRENLNLRR